MAQPQPSNVIPFPRKPRPLAKDGQQYPTTFSKVLAMHVHDHTRHAKSWAPSRERPIPFALLLIALGLGAAAAAVLL